MAPTSGAATRVCACGRCWPASLPSTGCASGGRGVFGSAPALPAASAPAPLTHDPLSQCMCAGAAGRSAHQAVCVNRRSGGHGAAPVWPSLFEHHRRMPERRRRLDRALSSHCTCSAIMSCVPSSGRGQRVLHLRRRYWFKHHGALPHHAARLDRALKRRRGPHAHLRVLVWAMGGCGTHWHQKQDAPAVRSPTNLYV